MKLLVACECSQTVTIAFRNLGYTAFSCDLLDEYGGHPEWHIKADAKEVIEYGSWDMIIAHPPCTYLSNAAAHLLHPLPGTTNPERYKLGIEAAEFFMFFWNLDCRLCIENPVPSRLFNLPEKSQIIQPYYFGDAYSKKTYLWLKKLPPLMPTLFCYKYESWVVKKKSSKSRSKTFNGIAAAMAAQWGGYLNG